VFYPSSYSRPRKLDDIAHQEEVVDALRNTLNSGNLPHLLFYGPPGTGKTSTILAVARELFGPEMMKSRVLELNASHERGIDVIRNKVKTFAQIAVSANETAPGYPCPPYKIIILDEADCMTRDAQSALRRTMENYTKVTRFCIICNYVSRIIDPITSRCAKFRYKLLAGDAMQHRLERICDAEGLSASRGALQQLMSIADGDMRRCITLLQTAQKLVPAGEELTEETVHEVAGTVPSSVLEALWRCAGPHASVAEMQTTVAAVGAAAYSADAVLQQLLPRVAASTELDEPGRSQVAIRVADAERKLVDGADEALQLLDVLTVLRHARRRAAAT
jgi:replication factor C subunit 2/4